MSTASHPSVNDFAHRIKSARDAAVLTQKELAERLGVSERSLQAWELGEAVPRQSHKRLALEFIAEQEAVA